MNNKNTTKNDRIYGKILGIKVTSTTTSSVLTRVENFISDSFKFYIVTPNPELILMAQDNQKLKIALNEADFAIPDGVGLKLAIPDLNITKGRKLFLALISFAAKKNWKVFLLGGLGDEAAIASRKLQITNPKLQIHSFQGSRLNGNAELVTEIDRKLQIDAINRINKFKPQLLFVAFGNPKQEIWIHENLSRLDIGGAMAVGGAFRYVAGLSSLPPGWMAKIGLEWLYRLITEPKRIGRIWNAVVVFPTKLLVSKLAI